MPQNEHAAAKADRPIPHQTRVASGNSGVEGAAVVTHILDEYETGIVRVALSNARVALIRQGPDGIWHSVDV